MPDATLGPKAQIMVDLAARREGVTIPEAAAAIHEVVPNASARLGGLVRRGYLVRLRRWRATRYFASAELAAAFAEASGITEPVTTEPVTTETAPHRRSKGAISEPVRYAMALAARPSGVRSPELAERLDVPLGNASSMLSGQVRCGRATVDKSGGKNSAVYRAIDPAAWADYPIPAHTPARRAPKAARKPNRRTFEVVPERAGGVPPPVTIKARPDLVPAGDGLVMAPHAQHTREPGWTHDPRYQCGPGERPFGAGFGAVGIGRDVRTGQAWGSAR